MSLAADPPPLTIKDVKIIAINGGCRYRWVFLKLITSEPGLHGYQPAAVLAALETMF